MINNLNQLASNKSKLTFAAFIPNPDALFRNAEIALNGTTGPRFNISLFLIYFVYFLANLISKNDVITPFAAACNLRLPPSTRSIAKGLPAGLCFLVLFSSTARTRQYRFLKYLFAFVSQFSHPESRRDAGLKKLYNDDYAVNSFW